MLEVMSVYIQEQKYISNDTIRVRVNVPKVTAKSCLSEQLELLARELNCKTEEEDVSLELEKRFQNKERYDNTLAILMLDRLYPNVLEILRLSIVGKPKCTLVGKMNCESGFDFYMEAVLKPEISLSSYEPLVVSGSFLKATSEEIDEKMLELASKNSVLKRKEDGIVQMGDIVLLDISTEGQSESDSFSRENAKLRVEYGSMPIAFLNKIIGLKEGSSVKIHYAAPHLIAEIPQADKEYSTSVIIREIYRESIPRIDDAWIEENLPKMHSVDELKRRIAKRIEEIKQINKDDELGQFLPKELAKRLLSTVPDSAIAAVTAEMMEELEIRIIKKGMSLADYCRAEGFSEDELRMHMHEQANCELMQALALDALFDGLNMTISESEIKRFLSTVVNGDIDSAYEETFQLGRMHTIEEGTRRYMAYEWLLSNSKVEE